MKKLLLLLIIVPMIGLSQIAVLVVGPQEGGTQNAIYKMEKIGDYLKDQGVLVKTFYGEKADWDRIKRASNGASFFIYCGHGGNLGDNGTSGGLFLTSNVSSRDIVNGLKLKKNAVVIFKSVCNGAGSSASDNGDIGLNEALRRVSDYSHPFIDIGVSCYYANNVGDGCLGFIEDFFAGKTVKECFINSTLIRWTQTITNSNGVKSVEKVLSSDPFAYIEIEKSYKYMRKMKISIASIDLGSKNYDITYVADPDFSINKL